MQLKETISISPPAILANLITRLESFYVPEEITSTRSRNIDLWQTDQPGFQKKLDAWVKEIKNGNITSEVKEVVEIIFFPIPLEKGRKKEILRLHHSPLRMTKERGPEINSG